MFLAVVQARMSSSRFPKKVLTKVDGIPLLQRAVNMCREAKNVDHVIVATSSENSDDPISTFCKDNSVDCFRGDLQNVAERFASLLRLHRCEAFVRICADSPIDRSWLIDEMIKVYKEEKADLVTNTFERTFPVGYSVEVVKSKTFLEQLKNVVDFDAEHFTQFFYKEASRFRLSSMRLGIDYSSIHLAIDKRDDLVSIASALSKGINSCSGRISLERFLEQHYAIGR